MSQTLEYKGYVGTVLFSAEDNILHGKVLGIYDSLTYEGSSIQSLRDDFEQTLDEYVAGCQADNRAPDAPDGVALALTMPVELRDRAETFAEAHHTDLEALVQQALTRFLETAA